MKNDVNLLNIAQEAVADIRRPVPRVLHIDSDDNAALVLAALLVPETQVVHAATMAEAQLLLAGQRFALVVLDPDLPDGDGTTLFGLIEERAADTPVLLYSASHPGLRSQRHEFLPKPWTSPRLLWRAVSQLLGIDSVASTELTR